MTTFAIVAGIVALALWVKDKNGDNNIFLLTLATPVTIVYGLTLAKAYTYGAPLWMAGVTIALIGTFCLFRAIFIGVKIGKGRNTRQ